MAERSRGVDLRVSDAERDAVVTELSEHFQAGRLDQQEFDERMAKALGARTERDLSALTDDLPPIRQEAADPARFARRPRFPIVLVPLLFAAAVASGVGGPHQHGVPWVLFPLLWVTVIAVLRFGWRRRAAN